jgi:hypothetical protein
MNDAISLLAGAGLGAGLMYAFDPQMGRRRRAQVRDKAVHLAHDARDVASTVARDVKNRAKGLASGDLSVLAGGKQALHNPLRGGWSPTARALMVGAGFGLFVYGLTRDFPAACILGTVGLALTAEGVTNVGLDDFAEAGRCVADKAKDLAEGAGDAVRSVARSLGVGGKGEQEADRSRQGAAQPTGVGI